MSQSKDRVDLNRRHVLSMVGSATAVGLLGLPGNGSGPEALAVPTCVVTPQQSEGPYFLDERLNRSDIRADPSDGIVRAGVPLRLTVRLAGVAGAGSCAPLAGAVVDLWHCDALGVYSDVRDPQGDTVGKKFLRGYQITDASGAAEFTTIYPGWYPGRAVHIHFKVRTTPGGARGSEFTSQLYFDEALTDQVHAQPPYRAKGRRTTTNQTDFLYRNGGSRLVLPLAAAGDGYAGTFDVGVRI